MLVQAVWVKSVWIETFCTVCPCNLLFLCLYKPSTMVSDGCASCMHKIGLDRHIWRKHSLTTCSHVYGRVCANFTLKWTPLPCLHKRLQGIWGASDASCPYLLGKYAIRQQRKVLYRITPWGADFITASLNYWSISASRYHMDLRVKWIEQRRNFQLLLPWPPSSSRANFYFLLPYGEYGTYFLLHKVWGIRDQLVIQ